MSRETCFRTSKFRGAPFKKNGRAEARPSLVIPYEKVIPPDSVVGRRADGTCLSSRSVLTAHQPRGRARGGAATSGLTERRRSARPRESRDGGRELHRRSRRISPGAHVF